MEGINKIIGAEVRKARESKNMTQLQLGKKLGYGNSQFVSLFERGLSKIPLEVMGKLTIILGIKPQFFVDTLIKEYKAEILMRIGKGRYSEILRRNRG